MAIDSVPDARGQAPMQRRTLDPDQIQLELVCASEGIQALGLVLGSARDQFCTEAQDGLGHAVWVLGKHTEMLTTQLEILGAFNRGDDV